MRENEYEYPDKEDKITAENVKRIEIYPGYWAESENNILNIVKKMIKPGEGRKRFLDAGCGEGRLIPFFESQFDEIVGVDPDPKRLKVAEKLIHKLRLSNKIKLKRAAIEDFRDFDKFDFILCSHVLQHVHTEIAPVIIKIFRSLIRDDGLICITTCHSTKDNGYFAKNLLGYSSNSEVEITRDEFNSLVNSREALPVHFFRFEEIRDLLIANDFKISDYRVFHLQKRLDGMENEEMDNAANLSPYLQKRVGWDMMVAAITMMQG